jgi:uncharacterized protein Yka (UPF0111/DUF47 family)
MILSVKKTDRLFFETFEALAAGAAEAALVLEEMFRNGKGADPAASGTRIKDIEHRCDVLIHELVKALHRTFITPIDREDIHDLGSHLDDLVDMIDAAASRAVLFRVSAEIPDAADLTRIIHRQAEEIRLAVTRLKDPKAIMEHASTSSRRRGTGCTARRWCASSTRGAIRCSSSRRRRSSRRSRGPPTRPKGSPSCWNGSS